MERLGSLLWSSLLLLALLGLLVNAAAPIALAGPVVKISDPEHGDVVKGQMLITVAYRSDSNQPIAELELLIDDQVAREYALATPRLEGSKTFSWDFTAAPGSRHTVGARATDTAGEVGSATISVTVADAATVSADGQDRVPPVISIYYPAQGAEVSGEVEVKAEATDNVGVTAVFFYVDGKFHTLLMNTPPYVARWDTTRGSDGPHVLQAKAMDENENTGTSAEVTVFVRNHDMTQAPEGSLQTQAAEGAAQAAPPAPAVGAQTGVTETTFGDRADQPQMVAALPPSEALSARVGYVPAVSDQPARSRTSPPRRTLTAAEPARTVDRVGTDTAGSGAVATPDDELGGAVLAAADFAPRMTVPRETRPAAAEAIGAAADEAIEETAALGEATGAVSRAGQAAQRASLDAEPETELAAARTTTPERSLAPSAVAEPAGSVTPADSTVMARSREADALAGAARIAMLPERAGRATISADGRLTLPEGTPIAPVAAMSFEEARILFDQQALALLAQPEVREGISIAPLREIFEHSGGVLFWYPIKKRVRAVRPGTEMHIQIGDPSVTVNEQPWLLELAPYIKKGRTMVPLQFIADTLDVTVTYNPETGQICLTSNEF
ncbi:MAG: Ig-like domain-containing protein [Armatimonadota bacterium]|nr:Ig-like domain-containing protein [Armatimonadota bacterium]